MTEKGTIKLTDIIDPEVLEDMIFDGYVLEREHPVEPLAILNYSPKCQWENAWNDVTRQCRGLIYNTDTLDVVARPFPKFFNYSEATESISMDPEEPVDVTDKLDGWLGILYFAYTSGLAIATRGSFENDVARWATWHIRGVYPEFRPWKPLTYLFEIINEDTKVIVDYKGKEMLVCLGAIETASGLVLPAPANWPGPKVTRFPCDNLFDALAMPPRPNAEGIVVHFVDTGLMVKIKQDDYVAMHRIVTHMTERTIWEYEAVRACNALIDDPKHWATYLGIDPARAKELIELQLQPGDWLEGVPDEFFGWVEKVATKVSAQAMGLHSEALTVAHRVMAQTQDRKEQWKLVEDNPMSTEIMRYMQDQSTDGQAAKGMKLKSWRLATPAAEKPEIVREEEVA